MTRARASSPGGVPFPGLGAHVFGAGGWDIYFVPGLSNTAICSTAVVSGVRLYGIPFVSPFRGGRISALAISVTATGQNARLGIYKATSEINMYPGALVASAAEIDCTPGGVLEGAVDFTFEPSTLYYAAYLGSAVITNRIAASSGSNVVPTLGTINMGANNYGCCYVAQAYGALPATFPGGATLDDGGFPCIGLKFAA